MQGVNERDRETVGLTRRLRPPFNQERRPGIGVEAQKGSWRERNSRVVMRNERRQRLPAGDVLFDKIGMLQADELDCEPILKVANHPTWSFADGDCRANLGSMLG